MITTLMPLAIRHFSLSFLIDKFNNTSLRIIPATITVGLLLASSVSHAQTLHFKSGFEGGTHIVDKYGNPNPIGVSQSRFAGTDTTTGYNWIDDLSQTREEDLPNQTLGNQRFNLDSNSEGTGAYVKLLDDPTSSGRGRVAQFWLSDPTNVKGRVQMVLYGSDTDLNEVTSITKVYFHPDLAVLEPKEVPALGYFIFNELFFSPDYNNTTNPDRANYRISFSLRKTSSKDGLFWEVTSDVAGPSGSTYWNYDSISANEKVPLGEWITLIMYYKKGDNNSGRIKLKYLDENDTEHVIFDITNWTEPNPSADPDLNYALQYQDTGLTHHIPLKIYTPDHNVDYVRENTSSGGIIIYWDDFEYYEGDAYTNYGSTTPAAPSNVTAAPNSSNPTSQIDLSWTDNANNETGFEVDRAENSSFSSGLVTDTEVAANTTSYQSSSLSDDTTYYFRVRATNSNGDSANSNIASATTSDYGAGGGLTTTFEGEDLSVNSDSGDSSSDVSDSNASADAYHLFNADATNDYVEYTLSVPSSDTYQILTMITERSNRGTYQLKIDGTNQGSAQDHYAAGGTTLYDERDLGSASLTAGTHTFRFECTGKNASATTYKFGLDYIALVGSNNSVPEISTSSLPSVIAGESYSETLSAAGGDGTLSWSVDSGSIPSGLSLSGGGVISGTPTTAGTANFTVRVADSDATTGSSDEDTQALSIVVTANSVPNITTTTLSSSVEDESYNQVLNATGGNGQLTWTLDSGSLPAGLNLSGEGVISGTPTTAGTANFTLRLADSDGVTGGSDEDTQALSIEVTSPAGGVTTTYEGEILTIAADSGGSSSDVTHEGASAEEYHLFNANATDDYISYTLNVTVAGTYQVLVGATERSNRGIYQLKIDATNQGSSMDFYAPSSPTLFEEHDLGSVSLSVGDHTFRFDCIGKNASSGSYKLGLDYITLEGSNSVPDITTTTLPSGLTDIAYGEPLFASGGDGTLTWTLDSGSLPAGLSLSSAGVISGTPTGSGTSNFTVRVADSDTNVSSSDEDTQALSIEVNDLSMATFTSIAADDGRILETSESSETGGTIYNSGGADIHLGDATDDRQWKSIVSFDTSSLPSGATIVSATLRLRRNGTQNINPFSWGGNCQVDIRNGAFNGSDSLETGDFEATASASNVAQMSSPASDGDWSEGTLDSSGFIQINHSGKTQFRVYFATGDNDNDDGDKIFFYSGEANTGYQPELIVEYY